LADGTVEDGPERGLKEENMTDKATGESRRDFLKLATTAAPVAAVAAVAGPEKAAAAGTTDQREGLRQTAHTKAYLDSARF